jgi:hypothetical protein
MISIICVYNNRALLERYLLKSLRNQSAKYQLILFDNSQGEFKSSAEIMNVASEKAVGEYLMFVHQDISFRSDSFLEDTEKTVDKIPKLGVVGAAGKSSEFPNTVTNIFHGDPPTSAGIQIKTPIRVLTLDSCLAIIPKTMYKLVQFDEKVVRGWYFFIVDYCLSVIDLGFSVYVIPMNLYHKSTGPKYLGLSYFIGLWRLLLKHRNYRVIYTTVGNWTLKGYFKDALNEILLRRLKD